jgi:hypothetical protein
MSQLFPINFNSSTHSIHIDKKESIDNLSTNNKNGPISFRPIIPKVLSKNVLSSTNDNIPHMLYFNGDQQDYSSTYRSLS